MKGTFEEEMSDLRPRTGGPSNAARPRAIAGDARSQGNGGYDRNIAVEWESGFRGASAGMPDRPHSRQGSGEPSDPHQEFAGRPDSRGWHGQSPAPHADSYAGDKYSKKQRAVPRFKPPDAESHSPHPQTPEPKGPKVIEIARNTPPRPAPGDNRQPNPPPPRLGPPPPQMRPTGGPSQQFGYRGQTQTQTPSQPHVHWSGPAQRPPPSQYPPRFPNQQQGGGWRSQGPGGPGFAGYGHMQHAQQFGPRPPQFGWPVGGGTGYMASQGFAQLAPAPPPGRPYSNPSQEQAPQDGWQEEAPEINETPSLVPFAFRQQHVALEKFFGKLREVYPQMSEGLLALAGVALLSHDDKAPPGMVFTKDIKFADLLNASEELAKSPDFAFPIVRQAFTEAKQKYLAGQQLPASGGQTLTSGRISLTLPRLDSKAAEAALTHLLSHPEAERPARPEAAASPASRPSLKTCKKIHFPKSAEGLLEPDVLNELHKSAVQDLPALLSSESHQLITSDDIDFGVVEMTQPLAYPGGHSGNLLPDVVALMESREQAWELDLAKMDISGLGKGSGKVRAGNRMRLRDLSLMVNSRALLVDVRAYPPLPHTFALLDDHGLCRDVHAQPSKEDGTVLLLPGQSYPLTLLLDTLDGNHRSAESGLLQQLILFTIVTTNIPKKPNTVWKKLSSTSTAVVFGCRVGVALTKRADDLNTLLNFEAKPYVTKHLETLFDSKPRKYWAEPPPLDFFFKSRRMVNDVCSWMTEGETVLRCPPPAFTNMGACNLLRKAIPAESQLQASEGLLKTLRKYSRLLVLEEAAMEDQIRKHDLFNIRYQFAIFEEASHQRQQYRLHDTLPKEGASLDEPPYSLLARKTYRGPSVKALFPKQDNNGVLDRRILLSLEVPGLPEERPSLVFGDTVYLRFAGADDVEFAGSVIATESTRCMLAMPRQFFYCCALDGSEPANTAQVATVLGLQMTDVKDMDFDLLHARFSFDRTRMARMHSTLLSTAQEANFRLLPPEASGSGGDKGSGLPSQDEFFAAARGRPGMPQPSVPKVRAFSGSLKEVAGKELNFEQRWAIASFLEGAGGGCPFTVYGPPGTGKTVTLVECALQILKREPEAKLLLCAPQGYSADLLASALAESDAVSAVDMMRIADPRHPFVQMKENVMNGYSNFNAFNRAFDLPDPALVASKRIIVMTCGAAGILRCGDYLAYHKTCTHGRGPQENVLLGIEFSHVLIDEAGQALVPEAMSPLALLQPTFGKALLCGDPKQLGPVVRSPLAANGVDGQGLAISLLELWMEYNNGLVTSRRIAGLAPATANLVQNYRSHTTLLEVPNTLFYDGTLVASADQSQLLPPRWTELEGQSQANGTGPASKGKKAANASLGKDLNVGGWSEEEEEAEQAREDGQAAEEQANLAELPSTLYFGVRGEQMRESEAPSYFNPIEATALVDLVEGLINQHKQAAGRPAVSPNDIGVIATYRKQVQKIRLLLRARGLGGIRVGTVDDMQGQEERIIFISTVLSKPETLPALGGAKGGEPQLGFWRNPRRFNVAITRAKCLLVILGHPLVLIEDACWREVLRFCFSRGAYRGAGSQAMSLLSRSDQHSSASYPGLTDAFANEQPGEQHDKDMAAAVSQIAEMALLGVGHAAQMFPESLDESYQAYGGECQWKVVL